MLPLQGISSLAFEEIEFPVLQGDPRVAGRHWQPKEPSAAEHSSKEKAPANATLTGQPDSCEQWFSSEIPAGLVKPQITSSPPPRVPNSVGLSGTPRIYISNKYPGYTDAAGLGSFL